MDTSPTEFLYDVFISYAREDAEWVMRNLYEPLIGCRAATGERARVYIDVGPEGLEPGVNWRDALASAIERTRVFLPVYSCTYFEKMNCRWELNHASNLDPTGERGRMSPLLIDPRAEQFVPSAIRQINHIPAGRDGWLAMICKRAGLAPDDTRVQLEFVDQPTDAFVNHTLAPVTVRTRASDAGAAKRSPEEEISLSATSGDLSGTVVLVTIDGEATFDDLSIQTVESSTRLVATVQGCVPAESDEFAVRAAPRPRELGQQSFAVRDVEDVHFFGDGRALAVVTTDRAVVFDLDGRELSSTELDAPPRTVRQRGTLLGLALWSGTCVLLLTDGQRISWRPGGGTGALTIPGDLALHDDGAYAGFWNGAVYNVGVDGGARVALELTSGIQALAVADGLLCVVDLDGRLRIYRDGGLVGETDLERSIHGLRARPGCVLAVGDRKLYHVPLDEPQAPRAFGQAHRLAAPAGALVETDVPVVIDGEGRGLRFNRDLEIRERFRTVAGALPTSADRDGHLCVLRNPDGSRSLMRDGRVVLTHPAGALAVSPSDERLALCDASRLKLMSADALDRLLAEQATT